MFRLVALITYANLLIKDLKSKLEHTNKLKTIHFHFHKIMECLKNDHPSGVFGPLADPSMPPTPLPPHNSSSPPIPRAPPCRVNPPQLHLGLEDRLDGVCHSSCIPSSPLPQVLEPKGGSTDRPRTQKSTSSMQLGGGTSNLMKKEN